MVGGSLRVLDFFQISTTKTGRHDIAEILLKKALNQSATLHVTHNFYNFTLMLKSLLMNRPFCDEQLSIKFLLCKYVALLWKYVIPCRTNS
jgi:hypothetical protein